MQLHLESHRKLVGQDPFCKFADIEYTEDRAEEHRTATGEVIPDKNLASPVVIGSVGQDKLRLVFGSQAGKIRPVHSIGHPTPWTLYIQYDVRAGIDRRDIDGAAGFKEDRVAGIAQFGQERKTLGLDKRFPSCDLHKAASIVLHLRQGLIDRALAPSVEGIVGIAPGAAEWASSQSYKDTGLPDVARLALDAIEDLGDAHGSRCETWNVNRETRVGNVWTLYNRRIG